MVISSAKKKLKDLTIKNIVTLGFFALVAILFFSVFNPTNTTLAERNNLEGPTEADMQQLAVFRANYSQQLAQVHNGSSGVVTNPTGTGDVGDPVDSDPNDPLDPSSGLCDPTPAFGKVKGFGWMGVNIQNGVNTPQGGGGWLKFNCEAGEQAWGTHLIMDEGSQYAGSLIGEAWSPNYGWMIMHPAINESCWQDAPNETSHSNPKGIGGLAVLDTDEIMRFSGWGKFINGDDLADDGYNGCISFQGSQYNVSMDTNLTDTPGKLRGWGWGSDVIGWLSFDCLYCDVDVVLPPPRGDIRGCMDPTATNFNPLATIPDITDCIYGPIVGCTDPAAFNFNPLATVEDRDSCVYKGCMIVGALNYNPQATIPDNASCRFGPGDVPGCTDSEAPNYNPAATIDDGSCQNPPPNRTRLYLNVLPPTLTIGQPNGADERFYATSIVWTSNSPQYIESGSCVGSQSLEGSTTNLNPDNYVPDWTGPQVNPVLNNVSNPSSKRENILVSNQVGVANPNGGTVMRFRIQCNKTAAAGGGSIFAEDTIIIAGPITPPADPPLVDVRIMDPNTNPSGDNQVGWSRETLADTGANVTLEWETDNVILSSCTGESFKYNASNEYAGPNLQWDGAPFTTTVTSPSNPGSVTVDMVIPGIGNGVSTDFKLTCIADDGATPVSDTVRVCVNGQSCPTAGGGLPGYIEF